MKWKFRLKYWIYAIAFTLIASFLIYLAIALYNDTLYFDSVNAVATFAIGMVSFLISIVALIFSAVTYVSIDSVNALSSMEGNVLCNENYNAEYISLVNEYSDCKTQQSLQEKLFDDIENQFKDHSKTCMLFTDFLQYFLDRLLWFAYVDTKSEDYQIRVNQIIDKIEAKYNDFNAISNGNQYVLREHLKLIKNVLNYQSVSRSGRKLSFGGELLNIRGKMLMNSVSKTVYYDYLGLEYHRHALTKLREITGFKGEEFLKENMDIISGFEFSLDDKREINLYLKQAKLAFDDAIDSSKNDMLWKGYISFNKARIDILSHLVNNDFPTDNSWQDIIAEAVEARYLVRKVFVPEKTNNSFLERQLIKEYIYAEALYLNLIYYKSYDQAEKLECKAEAQNLKEEIESINETQDTVYLRAEKYLEDILAE